MNKDKGNLNRNIFIGLFVSLFAFVAYVWHALFSHQQSPDDAGDYDDDKK